MSFNTLIIFILFVPFISADQQTVSITADVTQSSFGWIFHEKTKTTVTGIFVTIVTVLVGLIVYYVVKSVY